MGIQGPPLEWPEIHVPFVFEGEGGGPVDPRVPFAVRDLPVAPSWPIGRTRRPSDPDATQ
jgi:hypothetical protein